MSFLRVSLRATAIVSSAKSLSAADLAAACR